eukprot:1628862-Karenia_brevis.AAC.1
MNTYNYAAKDNTTITTTNLENCFQVTITLIHNDESKVETARMCMKEMKSHATLPRICWWKRR